MKSVILLTLFVALVECRFSDRKIFVSQFVGKTKSLVELQGIRKQIRDEALKNLKSLNELVKEDLIKHADAALKGSYPIKTATEYMEYFRDGNRDHYEKKLHDHRSRLAHLVIGNLLDQEHNASSTKYMSEIVNGIWILAEESTWSEPAHLYLEKTNASLPVPGHLALDLNTGEVAKYLGWIKLLIGDKLDQITPVINKRIDYELRRRIFQGFLDMDGYFWEGFNGDHVVNNWNIWINGNILKSALFTLDDAELFDKVLNKTLYSADYFLDDYGEDGGCDEGPAYWRQAGGRLIEYLESLEQIFPGARAYFGGQKLIQAIGQYSYKMLITKNWFVNFADAIPILTYPPSLLAKYGILFNDESMKQYAAYMLTYVSNSSYYASITDDINELFNFINTHAEIEKWKAAAPPLELVWLPDIEVVTTRSNAAALDKFFLAAKAGNNHESHNHNDVGNFVLYQNGFPVLIDIGVGTYTATTFGSHRYDLFYMQSQYHNCPTINGVQQKEGTAYNSHNTTLKELPNQSGIQFSSDIAGAYPPTAKVKQWLRSIQFNRTTNSIQLDDQFQLEQFVAPQQLHFITLHDIEVTKNERGLLLSHATNNVHVQMEFDWKLFALGSEERSLDGDHHLTHVWGDSVKRLTLVTNEQFKELNGHFTVRFMHA